MCARPGPEALAALNYERENMGAQRLLNGILPPMGADEDVFDPRPIEDGELPWIRVRHIWTGTMGNAYATFLGPTGVYFTFFCFASGMSKYQLGIMSAMLSLTVIAQMFSWVFEKRFGNRKYPWYIFSVASRLCFVPIVLSFWIPLGPVSIIALCCISSVLSNLAAPSWQSWLYDMIPQSQLPHFMSRRQAVIHFVLMALAVFAAMAMEGADDERKMAVVRWVFAFGLALGIIDLVFHVRIPEPAAKQEGPRRTDFIRTVLKPLSSRRFRLWVMAMSLWALGTNISGPFCIPYMMKDLGYEARFVALTLITICLYRVSGFASLLFCGRAVKAAGSAGVLAISYGVWALIPAIYMLSGWWWPDLFMIAAWFMAGIGVNCAIVAGDVMVSGLTANGSLDSGENRSTYLAALTICTAACNALGTLAGSLIVKYFTIWHTFPVSLAARLLSLGLICAMIASAGLWRWLPVPAAGGYAESKQGEV